MAKSLRMFPRYDSSDLFHLTEFLDAIRNGVINDFIMYEYTKIDDYPLGCFSMQITQPYNDYIVLIMVDLNIIREETTEASYLLRVEKQGTDGFIDIKTDIGSVSKAVDAILTGDIPLYNIHSEKHILCTTYSLK